jgi:hypothetical protein
MVEWCTRKLDSRLLRIRLSNLIRYFEPLDSDTRRQANGDRHEAPIDNVLSNAKFFHLHRRRRA